MTVNSGDATASMLIGTSSMLWSPSKRIAFLPLTALAATDGNSAAAFASAFTCDPSTAHDVTLPSASVTTP
jgi:hypothetical protein